jgi:hypothetical protein
VTVADHGRPIARIAPVDRREQLIAEGQHTTYHTVPRGIWAPVTATGCGWMENPVGIQMSPLFHAEVENVTAAARPAAYPGHVSPVDGGSAQVYRSDSTDCIAIVSSRLLPSNCVLNMIVEAGSHLNEADPHYCEAVAPQISRVLHGLQSP